MLCCVLCCAADDAALMLAQETYHIAADGDTSQQLSVQLGMLQLEASFGYLAWAGQFYPQRRSDNSPIAIHAQIVGAQVRGICVCCGKRGARSSCACCELDT